jgi:hypothetical protein
MIGRWRRRSVRRLEHLQTVNADIGGLLGDLAFAQSSPQKMFGYRRAAAAILTLDMPLTEIRRR